MKPVTIICLIMLAINAHAQIGKGKNVLSGNILYSTSSSSSSGSSAESNFSSLSAMPRYGHFFGEKTEVGITVGYNWTKNKNIDNNLSYNSSELTSGLFLVGPYVRFYKNLAERFYFNFTGSVTYYTGSSEQIFTYFLGTSKTEYTISEFQAGISPGLTYFFNDHWATNFSLGIINYDVYSSTNKETDNKTTTDTFTFGINAGGLIFGIGFYF